MAFAIASSPSNSRHIAGPSCGRGGAGEETNQPKARRQRKARRTHRASPAGSSELSAVSTAGRWKIAIAAIAALIVIAGGFTSGWRRAPRRLRRPLSLFYAKTESSSSKQTARTANLPSSRSNIPSALRCCSSIWLNFRTISRPYWFDWAPVTVPTRAHCMPLLPRRVGLLQKLLGAAIRNGDVPETHIEPVP